MRNWHVIYLGATAWSALRRRRQHLCSLVARDNRVLYVEPPVPVLTALRQKGRVRAQLTQVENDLWCWSPVLPVRMATRFWRLSGTFPLLVGPLRRAMKRLGFHDPVLFLNFAPYALSVLRGIPHRLCCYDCSDDFADGAPEWYAAQERTLTQSADVVLAVSRRLYESHRALNPRTHLVPNAVAREFLERCQDARVPDDMGAIRPPRLCFIGDIKKKTDAELLVEVGRLRPEWSLVLIGPAVQHGTWAVQGFHDLLALPNVSWLGPKPPQQLPDYATAADVCLLPLTLTDYNHCTDPLKLYEYLAAGRPIVSTPVEAIERFGDLVYTGATPQQFAAAAERALCEDSPELVQRRRAVAAENTWDRRLEQIGDILQSNWRGVPGQVQPAATQARAPVRRRWTTNCR